MAVDSPERHAVLTGQLKLTAAERRGSSEGSINHADRQRGLVLVDLDRHDAALSSMEPQPNLRAVHVVAFSADIPGGEESGKMEAVEADDLFAAAGVGLPAELEDYWIGGERDDAVIVLIVVVAENPPADVGAGRVVIEALNERLA